MRASTFRDKSILEFARMFRARIDGCRRIADDMGFGDKFERLYKCEAIATPPGMAEDMKELTRLQWNAVGAEVLVLRLLDELTKAEDGEENE